MSCRYRVEAFAGNCPCCSTKRECWLSPPITFSQIDTADKGGFHETRPRVVEVDEGARLYAQRPTVSRVEQIISVDKVEPYRKRQQSKVFFLFVFDCAAELQNSADIAGPVLFEFPAESCANLAKGAFIGFGHFMGDLAM